MTSSTSRRRNYERGEGDQAVHDLAKVHAHAGPAVPHGAFVRDDRESVLRILAKVREKYPNEVFSKIRAYPCSDPRRCRAQHGTRPGYAQLEEEWALLAHIQYALDKVDAGAKYVPPKEKKRIPVNDFKKICEVQ